MNRRPWLTLALLAAACAPAGTFDDEARAAAVAGATSALESFAAATSAERWDEVASMYADDPRFVWYEDGQVRYRSATEVRESLAAVTQLAADATLELIDPTVEAFAPGVAHATFGFRQSFATGDAGGFEFAGVITAVLIETAEGWRFLRGHTSTAR